MILFYLKIELTEEEEKQINDTLIEEYKAKNLAFFSFFSYQNDDCMESIGLQLLTSWVWIPLRDWLFPILFFP